MDEALTRPRTWATECGLFLARFILGIVFVAHGGQKVLGWFGGHGLAATVQAFHGLGIPAWLAYISAFVEFLGGFALIMGLLARLAALGIAIDMLVAIFKVHVANGFFATGPKPGFEYPLTLCVLALAIMLTGPGLLAVADWEASLFSRRRGVQPRRYVPS